MVRSVDQARARAAGRSIRARIVVESGTGARVIDRDAELDLVRRSAAMALASESGDLTRREASWPQSRQCADAAVDDVLDHLRAFSHGPVPRGKALVATWTIIRR